MIVAISAWSVAKPDMDSENTPIELHTLEQIHKAKTGAL